MVVWRLTAMLWLGLTDHSAWRGDVRSERTHLQLPPDLAISDANFEVFRWHAAHSADITGLSFILTRLRFRAHTPTSPSELGTDVSGQGVSLPDYRAGSFYSSA